MEPGEEHVPKRVAPHGKVVSEAPPLRRLLEGWTVRLPTGQPFAIGPDGRLYADTPHDVFVRLGGLQAAHGNLHSNMVRRRSRGRELEEFLGADDPIFHVRGPTRLTIAPKENQTMVVMALEDAALYVREGRVVAFDDRVTYESARLPFGKEAVEMLHLHGAGLVALRFAEPPAALTVRDGEEVRVDPDRVVGWTGRLFPNLHKGTAPYSVIAPRLVFRGEGAVLVG